MMDLSPPKNKTKSIGSSLNSINTTPSVISDPPTSSSASTSTVLTLAVPSPFHKAPTLENFSQSSTCKTVTPSNLLAINPPPISTSAPIQSLLQTAPCTAL